MRIFTKLTALLLALVTAASFMVACKDDTADQNGGQEPEETAYDLTDFTIVRAEVGSIGFSSAVSDVRDAIKSKLGLELPIVVDSNKEAGSKEILIGETDRMESKATVSQIKKKNEKNSWAIRIASDKIVITGTDDASSVKAAEAFIKYYVNASSEGKLGLSAGKEMYRIYDTDSIITTKNGTEIQVETESILYGQKRYNVNGEEFVPSGGSYPGITKLQYQSDPAKNGRLVAISAAAPMFGDSSTMACVTVSDDDGASWKIVARPNQKTFPGIPAGSMANIYELPAKLGDLPAGTLIYSHNIVDWDIKKYSVIATWISVDAGETWQESAMIDEAGALGEGVWEPFMIYSEEDGYLYCFYSDDSDPKHDQKIVYKRSKDGVNWEGKNGEIGTLTGKNVEPVDVIATANKEHRPGMPVITKMGNGEYFMSYEYIDENGDCVIRYRTTKNLADWGDPDNMGTLIGMWSAPSCAWLDAGGENGLLLVAAKGGSNNGYMMASFDYGKTWEKIEDPHTSKPIKNSGDRVGYSGFMFVANDKKTLYYVNSVNDPSAPKERQLIAFAKMYVYE